VLKKPSQKRSRERVELIIAATRDVLKTDGIKALSTNRIAAQAEIPVSSIYQYFPNKEAILVSLYEDYLEAVRRAYVEINTEENLQLHWKEYFTLALKKLTEAESLNELEVELELALDLYPELIETDQRHEEQIAEQMVDAFKKLGSRWSRPRLKRLAYFLYESNSAVWAYRARHSPPRKETFEWQLASSLAIVEQCFK